MATDDACGWPWARAWARPPRGRRGWRRSGGRIGCGCCFALVLTGTIALAEAVGGWLTNSLALLSDAGHMLTDVSALAAEPAGALVRGQAGGPEEDVRLLPDGDPQRARSTACCCWASPASSSTRPGSASARPREVKLGPMAVVAGGGPGGQPRRAGLPAPDALAERAGRLPARAGRHALRRWACWWARASWPHRLVRGGPAHLGRSSRW